MQYVYEKRKDSEKNEIIIPENYVEKSSYISFWILDQGYVRSLLK